MDWTQTRVAHDGTHHVIDGRPLYPERFEDVLAFHAPGLAPVRSGTEAWHIDVEGRAAYARRFVQTFGFYEGRAAAVSAVGWHHILPDGADLYREWHAWCGNFQEGLCTVRDAEGHYFHIRLDGKPANDGKWRYAGDFKNGIAVVQANDGQSTHIDAQGRFVHGRWFLDLDIFHKGLARARDEGGWMHVARSGQPAYGRRFAMVEPFYNGQARVEREDGGLEVIDEQGRTLVQLRPVMRAAVAGVTR